jgi:hypothetical protein
MDNEIKVWLSDSSMKTPEQLAELTPTQLAGIVIFFNGDFSDMGYSLIGTAKIEFNLVPREKMVSLKIEALQRDITTVKAAAQQKVAELEEKLQSLLAITNTVEA